MAPEVAELLLSRHSDLVELEIAEVTVLFADIRHFTRLVQQVGCLFYVVFSVRFSTVHRDRLSMAGNSG